MRLALQTEAAFAVLQREREKWLAAKREHDATVAEVSAMKGSMPNNYWHAEHEARRRYFIAAAVVEALAAEATADGQ